MGPHSQLYQNVCKSAIVTSHPSMREASIRVASLASECFTVGFSIGSSAALESLWHSSMRLQSRPKPFIGVSIDRTFSLAYHEKSLQHGNIRNINRGAVLSVRDMLKPLKAIFCWSLSAVLV